MTSEIFKDKMTGTIVDVAHNGRETIEYLTENCPDLCVIDFDLPDVDGPALGRSNEKNLPRPYTYDSIP